MIRAIPRRWPGRSKRVVGNNHMQFGPTTVFTSIVLLLLGRGLRLGLFLRRSRHSRHGVLVDFVIVVLLLLHRGRGRGLDLLGPAQVPVNLGASAVPLDKPVVGLAEVSAVEEAPRRTQRAGVHALENEMLLGVNLDDALAGGRAPRHVDDAARALLRDEVNDLLREALPAAVRVRVGLVRADRQAGVEHEHAAVRPRGQQAAVLGRRAEARVVLPEGNVHVLERRGGRGRGADGEGEAVGLVVVVVGVLADDDDFDVVEGGMTGPEAVLAYTY